MKTRHCGSRLAGGSLLATLIITTLVGVVMIAYLGLMLSNQRATARAEAWNAAIPVAEAGVEETLAHLNKNFPTNLVTDGWQESDGMITRERDLDHGTFAISFKPAAASTIYSTGYVRLAWNNALVARKVRVEVMRTNVVTKGIFARDRIRFHGRAARTDSFDSSNPAFSVNGRYDPSVARDGGDIGIASDEPGAFHSGNAQIFGKVSTGPNSSVTVGSRGSIGSTQWHSAGSRGIEPGWSSDDCSGELADAQVPFDPAVAFTPTGATVDGVRYDYVLGRDQYKLSQFGGRVLVTGHAALLVENRLQFGGQDSIRIAPGASLELYVACADAAIGGNSIINESGVATALTYYGLPSNKHLSISGESEFAGLIYAPNAEIELNGGATLYGAIIAREVTLNGAFQIHFDEALRRAGNVPKRFMVLSWDEI